MSGGHPVVCRNRIDACDIGLCVMRQMCLSAFAPTHHARPLRVSSNEGRGKFVANTVANARRFGSLVDQR